MDNLPSVSQMDGVDLVTEGILTLTRALEYLETENLNKSDAVGQLVDFLLDSDVIEFMLGATLYLGVENGKNKSSNLFGNDLFCDGCL